MRETVILLLLVINFVFRGDSQVEKKLHLVMFTSADIPTNFFDPRLGEEGDQDSTLLSILWVLDADSLRSLDTLNLNPFGTISNMQHCRHFASEKWIYIQEREYTPTFLTERSRNLKDIYDGNEDTYISVLDYFSDTILLRRMIGEKYSPFFSSTRYHDAFSHDGEIFYTYSFDKDSEYYGRYIIDKTLKEGHRTESHVFIDSFQVKLEAGLFFRKVYNNFLIGKEYKCWEFKKSIDLIEWPKNNFKIPYSEIDTIYYSRFNFLLNTNNSKYIIGYKSHNNGKHLNIVDSLEIYYVMDRYNFGVWDTILLPRDVNNFNVHEDRYLYGTHINSDILAKYNPKRNRDSTLSYMDRYPEKYSWKYANYPNLIYSKGVIFIYDLEARKYYELQLPDRDSEFLQIIDGWIYLRVYDEIWRMPFNREGIPFNLEGKEVLIKDKAVIPNVHHIFLKEKSPVVEKWITSKP